MKKGNTSAKQEEVEYKTKAGTAWSHSYLNQKPWHPLSYPNQRRKWIAEQTHAERQRRSDEVAREFAQEQDFFRTSALLTEKERKKIEVMQAVSFMYVRPPGYNAESARAAEIADERNNVNGDTETNMCTTGEKSDGAKKPRVKDLYGRSIPTEEEFPALKNAPRLESGATARVKPFAVEIRNVKCARCGNYGHQSGDRECPLKDSITAIEEERQKRDDPLTAIMNAVSSEPLKWELKQKPGGMSPPRGGYSRDDPNQQIIAEDIFDEYGGFLGGGNDVQDLFASLSDKRKPIKMHKKQKKEKVYDTSGSERESDLKKRKKHTHKEKRKKKEERQKRKHRSRHSNESSSDLEKEQRKKHKSRHSYSKTSSHSELSC